MVLTQPSCTCEQRVVLGTEAIDLVNAALEPVADRCPAVMFVQVRGMRQFAGLLGFELAAALLDSVEARLLATLRPCDSILRSGPDQFLLVLPNLLSVNHGILAARKVLREFEAPLQVLNRPITPLLSLSLAVAQSLPISAELLLRRGLLALDRALESNNRFMLAGNEDEDLWLQDDLRDALINNELAVHFQPVVDLRTDRICAVEALARWHSPRHGAIAPSRFIALAEQTGLAPELTRWSINAVLREYASLRMRAPDLRCAINLSPKVFGHSGLEEQIGAALAIWGIPPSSLILEVTETAVMENPELSSIALQNLRNTGINIAIDDFGQGYSSFTYLKHFPATELKIDQSFVTPMARDARARQLVSSMIDLAHHLGMRAVAEGVEDAETLAQLRDLGCDQAQGYQLGRPMDMAALLDGLGCVAQVARRAT